MKQVTQAQRGGGLRIEEVPPPSVQPGGVLVCTAYSLISSGTERAKIELARMSLLGKARARPEQARRVLETLREQGPLATYRKVISRLEALQPLGYSCSGLVIAVGREVEEFSRRDRVACAGAGYANHAEINSVPRNLCVKIPPRIGLDEAAFVTVGAIALQGVRQADVDLGESVAVIGLGLIGLLTVQILRTAGCRVLGMDPNPERCQIAESLGCAVTATDGSRFAVRTSGFTNGYGVDAVIVTASTSSNEPIEVAGRLCRDKGRIVVVGAVGMSIPRQAYYEKELELRLSRSYGPGRYDPLYEERGVDYPRAYVRWTEKRNMEAFLHLVADGQVKVAPLVTHRFPIDDADKAYELIQGSAGEGYLAVMLEYGAQQIGETSTREASIQGEGPDQGSIGSRVWVKRASEEYAALPKPSTVSIGLIGAGNFAQDVLIPALKTSKTARLRGVVTASGLSARSVADRFGSEYCSSDPADIFGDPEVHAVIVATRHDTHARFVMEALTAGKPVFVEKPLALNEAELDAVVKKWNRSAWLWKGAPTPPFVQVGFNRRFAAATKGVLEFLGDRRHPVVVHYRVNAGHLPRDHWAHQPDIGGGRIIGEGCHFVDLMLFLIKSEPVEVFAQALPDNGLYRQDNVSAQLRFADGSLATLHYLANGDTRLGKERVEIFCGGAMAVVDDFRRVTMSRGGRKRRTGHWWSAAEKGHHGEISAFLQAVCSGNPSPVPFEDAVQSMRVTFKIRQSLELGEPVTLEDFQASRQVPSD